MRVPRLVTLAAALVFAAAVTLAATHAPAASNTEPAAVGAAASDASAPAVAAPTPSTFVTVTVVAVSGEEFQHTHLRSELTSWSVGIINNGYYDDSAEDGILRRHAVKEIHWPEL